MVDRPACILHLVEPPMARTAQMMKCSDCGRFISPNEEWAERTYGVFDPAEEQYFPETEIICQKCNEGEGI
jgi:hypothetical protein